VRDFQKTLESKLFKDQATIEAKALSILNQHNSDEEMNVPFLLQQYHEKAATNIRDDWWNFFFKMAGVYR
jgi:hypothetical protein